MDGMLLHCRVTPAFNPLVQVSIFIQWDGEGHCDSEVSLPKNTTRCQSLDRTQTWTTWSGENCTNHEATGVNCYCFVNISDVLNYLKTHLPADGYCILGLSWVDLYPGEELNFVLGESSCMDGCAVMSFGHFEPQSYANNQLHETGSPHLIGDVLPLLDGTQCGRNNVTFSPLPQNKNSQDNIRLYLEDFAHTQNVDKQMIWRLLRVISHVCLFWCYFNNIYRFALRQMSIHLTIHLLMK